MPNPEDGSFPGEGRQKINTLKNPFFLGLNCESGWAVLVGVKWETSNGKENPMEADTQCIRLQPPKYYLCIMQNQVRVQSLSRSLPERMAAGGASRECNSVLFCVIHIYALLLQILMRFRIFLSWSYSIWVSVYYPQIISKELFNTEPLLKGCSAAVGQAGLLVWLVVQSLWIRIYLMCAVSFLADKGDSVYRLLGSHSPQNGDGKAK